MSCSARPTGSKIQQVCLDQWAHTGLLVCHGKLQHCSPSDVSDSWHSDCGHGLGGEILQSGLSESDHRCGSNHMAGCIRFSRRTKLEGVYHLRGGESQTGRASTTAGKAITFNSAPGGLVSPCIRRLEPRPPRIASTGPYLWTCCSDDTTGFEQPVVSGPDRL